MDRFVTVNKPSTARASSKPSENKQHRFAPYTPTQPGHKLSDARRAKKHEEKARYLAPVLKDAHRPSAAALTRHLLRTLSDELNPITHSDIGARADYVSSSVTGHQRSEMRSDRTAYLQYRKSKLEEQMQEQPKSRILANVRMYIDGFLNNTTDIEMKRMVTLAGGEVMHTASGATHIVTSQQLSGSKTHKILTGKGRINVHVVKPEWVTDSIDAGKRKPERAYGVIKPASTLDVFLR